MSGMERIEAALRAPRNPGAPGLVAYLTGGWPDRERFLEILRDTAEVADVIEVGVPFTDPMADGLSIQDASREALAAGASLRWILDTLAQERVQVPVLLMGYLNPFLAFGLDALVREAAAAGVCGFIVPDLPFEECDILRVPAEAAGLAVVQLVTPVTPPERARSLAAASRGFVYAVTMRGTTGTGALGEEVPRYLDSVREGASRPVCAGFGIRSAEQVRALAPHADGVIVGSALLDAVRRGQRPSAFLRGLVS